MPSFSWETAPLAEAKRRLAELEAIVKDARIKIAARETKAPKVYQCWSKSHVFIVPKSVMEKCKGELSDGKEVYRDDSATDGNGMIVPIRICSYLCYRVYQDYASQQKMQRNKR